MPSAMLLHQQLPEAELSWVVNDNFADVLRPLPFLKRLILFPRHAFASLETSKIRAFWQELRQEKYDYCLDYQGLFRSGLIAWLSGAGQRYGFAQAREMAPLFYTARIACPDDCRHAVAKNLHLTREFIRRLTGKALPPQPIAVEMVFPTDIRDNARRLLPPGDGPLLGMAFSSSWPAKNWPLEFFQDTVAELQKALPSLRCWLLGSPAEHEVGEQLLAKLDFLPAVNLAGKTDLQTLGCLLQQSQALLTNDSGPMHLAAALSIPCTALFGATDPALTGPFAADGTKHTVLRSLCPQSPCFQRQCPRQGVSCAAGISPHAAAAALLAQMT
jgi:lipopolysaccharide heptosyltransferase II